MSTGNITSLTEKARVTLQENARHAYGAMLKILETSPVSTQYITPGRIFSVSATASGHTQKDAAVCKNKFSKLFGDVPSESMAPELMMARVLKAMPSDMRELTMQLMTEELTKRVQSSHSQDNLNKPDSHLTMAI